jgi:cystathionine gamma-synthase/methionine-gamma-lyase
MFDLRCPSAGRGTVSLGKGKGLLSTPHWGHPAVLVPLERKEDCSYSDWATSGVFRFSVGLEDPDDVMADLEQALG